LSGLRCAVLKLAEVPVHIEAVFLETSARLGAFVLAEQWPVLGSQDPGFHAVCQALVPVEDLEPATEVLTFDKPEPRQDNGVRYSRRAEPTHGSDMDADRPGDLVALPATQAGVIGRRGGAGLPGHERTVGWRLRWISPAGCVMRRRRRRPPAVPPSV
jgi:hypothetical protein